MLRDYVPTVLVHDAVAIGHFELGVGAGSERRCGRKRRNAVRQERNEKELHEYVVELMLSQTE